MKLSSYERLEGIKLDEETHKYIVNLPSASKLIELLWPFERDKIPPKALEMGIQKGTCVHNGISDYIKGKGVTIESYCLHNKNTHTNALKWLVEVVNGLDIVEKYSEVSMLSFKLGYTGTFDLLYLDREGKWNLVDFKTTRDPHQEKEALQLSLYSLLIKENFGIEVDKFWVINTTNKIKYELKYDKENIEFLLGGN